MPSSASRRQFLASLAAVGVVGGGGRTTAGRSPNGDDGADESADDAAARPPELAWSRMYGEHGHDAVVDIVPAHGGGLLLAFGPRDEGRDVRLLGTDPSGEILWTRGYGVTEHDGPVALRRVADGYVLAGNGRLRYGSAPWLIRVAPDGTERWRREYRDIPGSQQLTALTRSPSGGFLLAGATRTDEDGREELTWALETDVTGRQRWLRTYDGGFAWLADVNPAPDGGYALVGHSHVGTRGAFLLVDGTLVRTDADGRERWRRRYGGADADRPQAVAATPTGFVLAGKTASPATPGALLVAVDRRGTAIWRRVLPALGWANGMIPLPDGYALVGEKFARTDRWGRVQWSFDGFGRDYRITASARTDGGFVVGGYTPYQGQSVGTQAWLAALRPR